MTKDNHIDLMTEAAKDAASLLLQDDQKSVHFEEGRDIKLDLDLECEKLIRAKLETTGFPILGEEFGGKVLDEDYFWVVDPIDGTFNYSRGYPESCVCIALMKGKSVEKALVYDFNNDINYWAVKGQGAYANDKKISVSDTNERNKAAICTGFPVAYDDTKSQEHMQLMRQFKKVRMIGSAAKALTYIANGTFDFYFEQNINLWDVASGILLITEAGGVAEYEFINDFQVRISAHNGRL